ncbi:hypothetical protein MKZ38_002161 [Zalerion maritima]|uniref:F-box domain-containing protein n=1 Tax=Zalerion maritima TaxID=339359 RepID=A0AAD5RES5_9PEZI|nr:hypothetical protein MKZ38_002161 [Zalerion maritima]
MRKDEVVDENASDAFKTRVQLRNHRDVTEKPIKCSNARQHKLITSKSQAKTCVDAWLTLKGGPGEPAPAELTGLRWVARLARRQEQNAQQVHASTLPSCSVTPSRPAFLSHLAVLIWLVSHCTVPTRKRRRTRSLDGNDTEFDHHGLHRQPRSSRITRSRAATDCALAAGGAATGRSRRDFLSARLSLGATFSRRDFLSPLPNELAIRILSNLSAWELLDVSLVSKQLSAWASSPQLWRGLYYRCFVLPDAGSIF